MSSELELHLAQRLEVAMPLFVLCWLMASLSRRISRIEPVSFAEILSFQIQDHLVVSVSSLLIYSYAAELVNEPREEPTQLGLSSELVYLGRCTLRILSRTWLVIDTVNYKSEIPVPFPSIRSLTLVLIRLHMRSSKLYMQRSLPQTTNLSKHPPFSHLQ